MTKWPATSSMKIFLSDQQQPTVIDCYLQLMAEDKIRRDARLKELTESLERLQQEVNQQHRHIRQLQQALDEQAAWRTQAEADLARQDRLLAAYRVGTQDLDDQYSLVDGLFQQALESPLPAEAIDLYREIADAQQPDEPTPVRQLRALSRFNIGVVLMVNDPHAARKAYEQVLAEYGSDPDPLVQQLYRTAGQYIAKLEHTAAA